MARVTFPEWVRLEYAAGVSVSEIMRNLRAQGIQASRRTLERTANRENWAAARALNVNPAAPDSGQGAVTDGDSGRRALYEEQMRDSFAMIQHVRAHAPGKVLRSLQRLHELVDGRMEGVPVNPGDPESTRVYPDPTELAQLTRAMHLIAEGFERFVGEFSVGPMDELLRKLATSGKALEDQREVICQKLLAQAQAKLESAQVAGKQLHSFEIQAIGNALATVRAELESIEEARKRAGNLAPVFRVTERRTEFVTKEREDEDPTDGSE